MLASDGAAENSVRVKPEIQDWRCKEYEIE